MSMMIFLVLSETLFARFTFGVGFCFQQRQQFHLESHFSAHTYDTHCCVHSESKGEKEGKQVMVNYSHCSATRDSWKVSVTFPSTS